MNTKNILFYSGLLIFGLFLGYLFFGGTDSEQAMDEHIEETHTDDEGNVVYTCSMHPQVRQNEPGNCPICGMELIPADDGGESADNPYTLTMTQASMKLAEIQTTPVVYETPVHTLTLPGKVKVDERNLSKIPAHFHGRIEELYVNFTGEHIARGQKIARVYSPLLYTAQTELIEAYKNRKNNPEIYRASRNKLLNWKISEAQIDQIVEKGIPSEELDITAHKSGYVLAMYVRQGDHLDMGDIMYEISSLSDLWVTFEAYESDVSDLQVGDTVTFTVASLPGQEFKSPISYINPFFDNETRTVTIRTDIQNPDFRLSPGMFAKGIIESKSTGQKKLMIPRSAIMWTGKRSIVYVQLQNTEAPTFEAREVVLGSRAGNYYVVESGLNEGEQVVTNGTFKIDSAAQLSDKLSMMNREPGTGANRGAHDHGSMDTNQSETDDHSQHQQMELQSSRQSDGQQSLNIKSQQEIGSIMPAYLKTREALANDNFEEANAQFRSFTNIRTNNIEELRAAFKQVSEELVNAVEEFGYEGTLYKQFCPMYGGGSHWISDNEEIENPYYGDQMHNCGETVEAL